MVKKSQMRKPASKREIESAGIDDSRSGVFAISVNRLWTVADILEYCSICRSTLSNWRRKGAFPPPLDPPEGSNIKRWMPEVVISFLNKRSKGE